MFKTESAAHALYADVKTVGIPRALMYYRYKTLWKTFFEELGRTVVLSEPTNRELFEKGDLASVDECCLASKIYMGHAESLLDSCDAIFVPNYTNVGRRQSFCTKFQALPDLVTNTFHAQNPRIISCLVDEVQSGLTMRQTFEELALEFGVTKKEAKRVTKRAFSAYAQENERYCEKQRKLMDANYAIAPEKRPLSILVAAHPYVIHDPFIGGPVSETLEQMGICALYTDGVNPEKALNKSQEFSATLPWIVNREIIGAILTLYKHIDGIILVSAFPCGPDSMTNDAITRNITGKPTLTLTVDAQSGTAGLETRIESFVDILRYQKEGGYFHE